MKGRPRPMKKLPPSKRMSKAMRELLEQGTEVAQFFKGHTDLLDKLVAEMYARDLSTGDIEDTLVMLTWEKVLSNGSISRVTEALWKEYQGFSERDLFQMKVEYLFLDAIYESLRSYRDVKEAVLY